MRLEEVTTGLNLSGVEPTQIVSVVATVPLGEGSLQLIYRTPDGSMKERLLGRADEASINIAASERPFSFDGDGASFQIACEAKRIDLAFLFDPMMAVHTSNVDPLPHQITAVYESMLPRQSYLCDGLIRPVRSVVYRSCKIVSCIEVHHESRSARSRRSHHAQKVAAEH